MQDEVTTLSAKLEQKCDLLEKSTSALESSNKAVDVFSILIQHMTQSVSAFQIMLMYYINWTIVFAVHFIIA